MISLKKKKFGFIRRYPIVGGRRLSNYWWSVVIFLGGCGFLLTGISSYFNRNLLLVTPQFEKAIYIRSYKNPLEVGDAREPITPKGRATFGMQRGSVPEITLTDLSYTQPLRGKGSGLLPKDKHCASYLRHPELPEGYVRQGGLLYYPTLHTLRVTPDAAGRMPFFLRKYALNIQRASLPAYPSGKQETKVDCFPKPQTTVSTLAQPRHEKKDKLEIINGASAALHPSAASQADSYPKGEADPSGSRQASLLFFPQGLVLSFYGFLALCFSFHLWLTLIWKIGAGFNEFNGKDKYVRLFRWGRPGKNRRIDIKYTNEMIETLKIELVPKPALVLHVKGKKYIPLTNAALIGEFIPLEDLETQATELTTLLKIPLEIAD